MSEEQLEPTEWIVNTDKGFILYDSVIPHTPWPAVRKGYFAVSYGTGRTEGQTFYFASEEDAQKLFDLLKKVEVVTRVHLAQIVRAAFQKETIEE